MYSTYPTISKTAKPAATVRVGTAPTYDELVTTLRLIEHATAPTHDDGAYHEAAHDLASQMLQRLATVPAPAVGADDARDAARYRWLRDKANRDTRARAPMVFNAPGNGKPVQWTDALYESYLDEAMDVAMESNPPVQHKEQS